MHRLAELVEMRNPFLQQIAAAAVPPSSRPACAFRVRVSRKHDHTDVRVRRAQIPAQANAPSVDIGDIRTSVTNIVG
jgi:hypothetical protein